MDISTVDSHVNLGGIDQPVIGQRKVTFDVRMREGEVNVLGGLMQSQQSKTTTGWPLLSSVPILGKLFSRESIDNSVSELLFVLIPHIVRAPEITETNMRGVASGSDTVVKLNYAPASGGFRLRRPWHRQGYAPTPRQESRLRSPGEFRQRSPPACHGSARPALPATTPAIADATVSFSPRARGGALGSAITVALMVENASDLFTAPFRMKFDPKIVRLNDVMAGGLLTSDGKPVLPPSKNIMNDTGEASITLSRMPGSGGVSGGGVLVTFVFQAIGKGTTTVSFTDFALRDSKLQQIPGAPPPVIITVR